MNLENLKKKINDHRQTIVTTSFCIGIASVFVLIYKSEKHNPAKAMKYLVDAYDQGDQIHLFGDGSYMIVSQET